MNRLFYLSPLLLIFLAGCSKNPEIPGNKQKPVGTFTGQFLYIHVPANSAKLDTSIANVQLVMNSNNTYAITGDTSVLHAGSHGNYTYDTDAEIQFYDATYPTTGTPTKTHLSGIYTFAYDGLFLNLTGNSPLDTVTYRYNLKKN